MKVYYELDLRTFEAWSGARNTLTTLTSKQIDALEFQMENIFPEHASETEINDFLWFETDTIAQMLGFDDWEVLEKHNKGED